MGGVLLTILGVKCLAFEGLRPQQLQDCPGFPVVYQSRHTDIDFSFPSTLEPGPILANFWGTILAEHPIAPNHEDLVLIGEIEMPDGTVWAPWTDEDEAELKAILAGEV